MKLLHTQIDGFSSNFCCKSELDSSPTWPHNIPLGAWCEVSVPITQWSYPFLIWTVCLVQSAGWITSYGFIPTVPPKTQGTSVPACYCSRFNWFNGNLITHRMRPPQRDWLGRRSQQDKYCPKKDSSLSCSVCTCSLDLKTFNDCDSTTDDLSRFQIEPQAVAVSPYGWLMTHYGWLAGLSRLAVASTAAA